MWNIKRKKCHEISQTVKVGWGDCIPNISTTKKKLTYLIRNNVFVFILNMISVCLRTIKTWITLQYPSNWWKITPGTNISTFSLIFQCFKRTPDQRWILTRAIICRFAGYQKTQESGIAILFFIWLAIENNHMHTLSAYF